MKSKDLIKVLDKYCHKITNNGGHYKCYPRDSSTVITISSTSSDQQYFKQVARDFRRAGIVIKELF